MSEQIPADQGRIVVVNVPDPLLGADWAYIMPVRTRWALRSVQALLTTSVVVADRIPELQIIMAGFMALRRTARALIPGNSALYFGWYVGGGAPAIAGQTAIGASMPERYLLNDNSEFQTQTVALDAGDQWSEIMIVAEEWIEPLV